MTSRTPAAAKRVGRPPIDIKVADVRATASRLFAEHGYAGVTLERLATELGVSRSTLYRTISSKRELMSVLLEELIDELGAQAEAISKSDRSPEEKVLALVRLHITAAVRMRHYFIVWFDPDVQTPATQGEFRRFARRYDGIWKDAIEEAVQLGELAPVDPRLATNLLIGMCNWVSKWHRPGGSVTEDTITLSAMALLGFPGRLPDLGPWQRPGGWLAGTVDADRAARQRRRRR